MSIEVAQTVSVRAALLGQLTAEHHTTRSVIEHVLDDQLSFAPDPRVRGFGELALHIYQTGQWFVETMERGELTEHPAALTVPNNKSELLGQCDGLNRDIANRANALTAERLARIIEFPKVGPFPAVTYLGWHLNHTIHHRGQLTVYLRLMGAKVPSIYGPSLDYP